MDTPPTPFEALAHITEDPDPAKRARTIGAALASVPDLQKWLRHARELAVGEMRDGGLSHADVAKILSVSRARAQQIAEGRTTGKRAEPKPPASPDG